MLLNANVDLDSVPSNGINAYYMVVAALSAEIEEKSEILAEMKKCEVKRQFINGWTPGKTKINIHV